MRSRSPRAGSTSRAAVSARRGIRSLLGGALLLILPGVGSAQDVQVSGFAGWRFGGSGRSPVTFQEIDIAGAGSFGGTASLRVWGRNAVELYFSRAESTAQPRFEADELEVELSYLHLGLVHELDTEGVRPFLGLLVGGARVRQPPDGARTLFSAGAVVGVRVFPTPHLGLRAEGRGLLVLDDERRGRSRDSEGAGFSVGGHTILQGELNVGLVLAF